MPHPLMTPLYEAIRDLELAAALVLLAEQEAEPIDQSLARLRAALAEVDLARDLAAELASCPGRPPLHVIVGTASGALAAPAVA